MKRLSKKARMSETRAYLLGPNPSDTIEAQLIDIDFYPRMSEETLAFNATLRIKEGIQTFVYDCHNDGHGGSTTICPNFVKSVPSDIDHCKELLKRWNDFLSTQRDDKFYAVAEQMGWSMADNGRVVTKSAESEVNNLLAEWCEKHNL